MPDNTERPTENLSADLNAGEGLAMPCTLHRLRSILGVGKLYDAVRVRTRVHVQRKVRLKKFPDVPVPPGQSTHKHAVPYVANLGQSIHATQFQSYPP